MKIHGEVMLINDKAQAFKEDLKDGYVDKTQLISYTNSVVSSKSKFVCVSRPRRFGKSIAVHALAAYYSKDAQAKDVFAGLKISQDLNFRMTRSYNKYLFNAV